MTTLILETSRRGFLKLGGMAAGLPAAVRNASAASHEPVIEIRDGKLRGQTVAGIHTFKGIPYGADTSGKNRFMPPKAPAPWTGIRDATQWGQAAPQRVGTPNEYSRLVDWTNLPGGQGENCLVLNVWTPALGRGKRPVLFSIHGGGFTSGTSGNPVFDGTQLAKRGDVVVVTINHRLGSLGYLHLGDLDPEFAQSGVVGLLDCVAALEWVRDNIGRFGGDPANVMIFGQSGGGSKVSHLMAMPGAKGLFHRAVMQSGVALRSGSRDDGTAAAEKLLASLDVSKKNLRQLQDMPFEKIIAAQAGQIRPIVDGVVVPRHPFDPDAPAVSAQVPVLVGSCLHDSAFTMTNLGMNEAEMKEQARKVLGESAERIVAAYRAADSKTSASLLFARMMTDRGLRRNAIRLAELKAKQNSGQVYMYRLDWPSPAHGGKYGSVHGTDVPLTFDNPDAWPLTANGSDARTMASRVADTWIAFARTGKPKTKGLPDWPAYNEADRATMLLDVDSRVVTHPDRELLALFS